MKPIQIRVFSKPLDMRITKRIVSLPADLQAKIQANWQTLTEKNPHLSNGEVFTVSSVDDDSDKIRIRLDETNYAHYLYSQQVKDLDEYTVRIIHPAALVITHDNQMVFGSMGEHTSLAGTIQCCGGGIDRNAIEPDGAVLIDRTMISELSEELGIVAHDERVVSMVPSYLKTGGPTGKMTLIYVVKLNITGEQFMQDYADFARSLKTKGEEPEFSEIFNINNEPETVDAFIEKYKSSLGEYMPILLRTVTGITPATHTLK